MRQLVQLLGSFVALIGTSAVHADSPYPGVENMQRAEVNYMLNCQGCHGPTGAGTDDGSVPVMTDFVAKFLNVDGGREFLVQVPGSANAALTDERLAEVMNWMLFRVSPDQVPAGFSPYTTQEVGALRKSPLSDVEAVRENLVEQIELHKKDAT